VLRRLSSKGQRETDIAPRWGAVIDADVLLQTFHLYEVVWTRGGVPALTEMRCRSTLMCTAWEFTRQLPF